MLDFFFQYFLWQDVAISIGSFIGLITKIYALADSETIWSRRSSLTNILFYPPSLVAFATLGLWITFTTSTLSFLTWIGIAIWRAPDEEDWLGRR
jgi:hypothetical protein